MKLNYLAIPYLAILAFMFSSIFTSGGLTWYESLVLPAWHPSADVIAVIWGIIYFLGAWSVLILWNTTVRDRALTLILWGFGLMTLLNLVWSIVFFRLHDFTASVWCAGLLGTFAFMLAVFIHERSPRAAMLLIPYIAWVFFAAYLNYTVAMLNP